MPDGLFRVMCLFRIMLRLRSESAPVALARRMAAPANLPCAFDPDHCHPAFHF